MRQLGCLEANGFANSAATACALQRLFRVAYRRKRGARCIERRCDGGDGAAHLAAAPGFTIEWTGQSLQEKQSTAQAPLLLALSMLIVFLVLAALYESWSIPLSVVLVVPLGIVGAVVAVLTRGLANTVFFRVGLITIIGLSAKNAILIIEFANSLRAEGSRVRDAVVEAARLRLRRS